MTIIYFHYLQINCNLISLIGVDSVSLEATVRNHLELEPNVSQDLLERARNVFVLDFSPKSSPISPKANLYNNNSDCLPSSSLSTESHVNFNLNQIQLQWLIRNLPWM